jgi:hypothetical protein
MAYDEKTNREAVRAYSHAGVTEYIPRRGNSAKAMNAKKPSVVARIKGLFGMK